MRKMIVTMISIAQTAQPTSIVTLGVYPKTEKLARGGMMLMENSSAAGAPKISVSAEPTASQIPKMHTHMAILFFRFCFRKKTGLSSSEARASFFRLGSIQYPSSMTLNETIIEIYCNISSLLFQHCEMVDNGGYDQPEAKRAPGKRQQNKIDSCAADQKSQRERQPHEHHDTDARISSFFKGL